MIIIKLLVWLLLGFILLIALVLIIGYLLSCKGYKGPVSSHFNGKQFLNPSKRSAKGIKEVSKFARERTRDAWPSDLNQTVRKEPLKEILKNEVAYTFINHSTFLIQLNGLNILTDPIWSKRCSPFQFAGPARQRPPGIRFEDLPNIDLVLISHNHYDHLDKKTIKRLLKKHQPQFIVPLGLKALLKNWGCKKVVELDWHQDYNLNGLLLEATPANHFSSRGIFDRNNTLWCGYLLKTESHCLYFIGDTGYSDIFKSINPNGDAIDLAFIPIGAYKPEWFMGPIHTTPEQAVQIHLDIKCKKSIAMHFGTFKLANDAPDKAIKRLNENLELLQIPSSQFVVPQEGIQYLS